MTADLPLDQDPGAMDARAVRRHFARAAATYDGAAVLQREVGRRMAERLDVVKLAPAAILDAGCGTGDAQAGLALRYPAARRVALDIAPPMLGMAKAKAGQTRSAFARMVSVFTGGPGNGEADFVCGDVAALPFAGGSFDLAWSNLMLQWVGDLPGALKELNRVLRPDGLITFSTFGPDTLRELRAAFAGIDRHMHVGRFADMHDIGDMLVGAGFGDPVMHMELFTLTYADAPAMLRDLKAIGATNATRARPRALMGRARWERALAALDAARRDGRIPATFEVIYGHAWKAAPKRTPEGDAIVAFRHRVRG
jgi:malonyl-CoA O-methyltransferase